MNEDIDFEDTVKVNLDELQHLESIEINHFHKKIEIFGTKDINTKIKIIKREPNFSIQGNLLFLALESYLEDDFGYD